MPASPRERGSQQSNAEQRSCCRFRHKIGVGAPGDVGDYAEFVNAPGCDKDIPKDESVIHDTARPARAGDSNLVFVAGNDPQAADGQDFTVNSCDAEKRTRRSGFRRGIVDERKHGPGHVKAECHRHRSQP